MRLWVLSANVVIKAWWQLLRFTGAVGLAATAILCAQYNGV